MLDLLTDEAFLKPAAVIIAILLLLMLLRKINKVLLVVGILVISMLYLLNNRPEWLDAIIRSFQY